MKEAIIRYKDAKTLEILKDLAKHFGFTISETDEAPNQKKTALFKVLHVGISDREAYKLSGRSQ